MPGLGWKPLGREPFASQLGAVEMHTAGQLASTMGNSAWEGSQGGGKTEERREIKGESR